MVNTPITFLPPQQLQQTLVQRLGQLAQHQLTSHAFVQWAEAQHWQLLEGIYKNNQTPLAQMLRETLADILLQWDCLQAHQHEIAQNGQVPIVEFPNPWLTTWLNQIQPTPEIPMSSINFNGSVGIANVNSTIHGNQTGVQTNATDPEVEGAIADLQTLITSLQTQHPTVTSETQALTIIDAEFTEIKCNPTHKLAALRQQLLNPERHLQATKASLIEVTKKWCENSLIATAIITYLDKLSETPDRGA
jgi:hypothetical protein